LSEVLAPIAYQLGAGGLGGFLVGYAAKKIAKIVAVIIGLFILVLVYLGSTGMISVNYERLAESISRLLGMAEGAPGLFITIVSHLPFAASFVGGFALGLKMG